jgi:hypothetical protein
MPVFIGIKGVVAEWLGSGLQHHLQRFESARHLKKELLLSSSFFLKKIKKIRYSRSPFTVFAFIRNISIVFKLNF